MIHAIRQKIPISNSVLLRLAVLARLMITLLGLGFVAQCVSPELVVIAVAAPPVVLLVRREAFEDVGGLDEGYFMYAEEVDWCYAMREKGWQVWYQPAAKVIHLGGGSSRNRRRQREADLYRSRVRFFRKHYGDRAAWLVKSQIYGLTAIKIVVHGLLRLVSAGQYGRSVVPLRYLAMERRET